MKKKTKLLSLISTTLAGLALSLGVLAFHENLSEEVAAVDITDYSACETAHKNKSGSAMLTALRNITAPGSAGSYAQLWETYKTAYLRSDGKIFDYYSNISNFRPGTDQAGSYKGEGDVYNREHSIPKSWWGGAESNQGADPFIVVPTDGYVNNRRSNYPMGPVGSASYQSENGFSKLGTVKSGYGYSGTVFEPDDSVKGDFARIVFYAIAKYSASYGWTSGEGSSTFSGSASTNYGLTNYAVKFYSEWSAQDPVSDWERSVNDAIAPIQGNRNPFIDHPEYANTLWGTNSNYTPYPEDNKTLTSISLSNKTTSFEVGDTFIKPTVTANYDDSSTKDVTNSAAFSGYDLNNTGNQTVTVSYTEGGVTKTATYSITVTASTKTLSSISVNGQTTSFKQNKAFSFGGTVTATYSNSTQADVTDSATFAGYDMSQIGNQTVTVSYTYQGVTKTTSYGIEVTESQGGQGEETNLEISFTGSKSSSTDTKGNVWSANGDFTTGSSYLRLNKETSYISNGTPLMVDTSETMTVTASLRTYGGANSQSLKITAYNDQNAAISNTLTLSPTSSSLATYSGTLTFTNSTDHEVYIKAYSGNNYSLGISGMSFNYMSWEESIVPTLSGISVATAPTKTTYVVDEYFNPAGLVINRNYSDSTSDTYTYADHTFEFSFTPSTSTALTVANTSVTITYGGKSCSQAITVSTSGGGSSEPTSITASVSKTYYVGETISTSDITVEDNNGDEVEGFSFANDGYAFTYNDAASGGALTNKTFNNSISYNALTCSLIVQVQRKAYATPTGGSTLEHTGAEFKTAGIASGTSSSYKENQTATVDGVTFNVSGYVYNNTYLSFSTSSSKAPGSLISTTPYPSGITNVTINGASPDIQLSTDGDTWVDFASASTSATNYYYLKVYFKNTSQSGYINISSISVTLKASETAENVSNYIMYEDTNNQCVSKLSIAMSYFGNLTSSGKSTFASSDDYVIKSARERLEAWAANQEKTINYSTGELTNKAGVVQYGVGQENSSTTIIIIVSAMSVVSLSVLLIIKKKRLHN